MKARHVIWLMTGLAAGVLAGYHAGSRQHCGAAAELTECMERRETEIDSVRHRMPEARGAVAEVRREIVRLRRGATQECVASLATGGGSGDGDARMRRHLVENCGSDSVDVEIAIEQKTYGDSTYRAWVSGYRARLDSIEVYPRRETVTVTRTTRQPPRRWGIGVSAGCGYAPGKGMVPYVGIGITYTIFSF